MRSGMAVRPRRDYPRREANEAARAAYLLRRQLQRTAERDEDGCAWVGTLTARLSGLYRVRREGDRVLVDLYAREIPF
jgi:hypothetical protein